MLSFVSLFAGIGGFDLGFEQAGMVCKQQVEIDDSCNEVLAYHWPDVQCLKDVKDVGRYNLETVDLVCGGFPCQDVSIAGRREGLDGERSGLWFEFIRIVEELRPKWVVIENVPGLLSSNERRDFAIVLSGLGQRGYWWAYRVLDAQFFGVPQRRRRVFVVGCLTRGCAQEVLFERESSPWDTAPGREARAQVADPITKSFAKHHGRSAGKDSYPRNMILAAHDTGQGWWNQSDIVGTLRAEGENRPSRPSNVVVCFDRSRSTVSGPISGPLRVQGSVTPGVNPGKADAQCVAFDTTQITGRLNRSNPQLGDPCHPLATEAHPPAIAWHENKQGELTPNHHVRRLTPLECERLQGFPDGWTAVKGMSDSARYRMLGNAVCVPVAEWLGKRILSADG